MASTNPSRAYPQWANDKLRRAQSNWSRYEYGRSRGHREFCSVARWNERMYLGGGEQWLEADKQALAEQDRKPVEQNEILPAINAAIGYQIANRLDISFKPRGGGADDQLASTLSKVAMQIADNTKMHWKETQVYADGLIQQRGYYDIRMGFDDSLVGEVRIEALDPLDVIPDPDAKDYDPATWQDVIITRWYTYDEIEQFFGKQARQAAELYKADERDYGEYSDDERRNKFGNFAFGPENSADAVLDGIDTRRVRVIDRQYRVYEMTPVVVWPTGDVRQVDNATPEQIAAWQQAGGFLTKRMSSRVKWLVTTSDIVLFDDYSPYPWFTVIPYFPIFRRGRTRGLVDNARSPQETLNKALSQFLHILGTTANSGWQMEEDQLVNMTYEEFEEKAGKTGLIVVRKQGSKPLEKIQPNTVPSGIAEVITTSHAAVQSVMGVNAAMQGDDESDISGVAIQSRQYAAQQKLAVPLDNLSRTRHMLAERILWCIQNFYIGPRIIRITRTDDTGQEATDEVPINQPQDDGSILNDMTVGEYDVVISEQPLQVTFDNSQFEQITTMIEKLHIPIPPKWVLRYSTLADKQQIAQDVEQASQQQPDPLNDAKEALTQAQAKLADAQATQAGVTAIYSATQAGAQVGAMPQVASLADEILASVGFTDQNAPPIIPTPSEGAGLAQAAPPVPTTQPPAIHPTNPVRPATGAVGLDRGIEKPGVQP
jgi:hypothetical protein